MKYFLAIAIAAMFAVLPASASITMRGVGSGSAGGGTFTPSYLLIQTGSIMLINTGSKLEIHG